MSIAASIIIPNFENGRESSVDGATDLLGDLLESLQATLADDPTEHEILVADHGSQDDSLATARAWAGRIRPDGRPFCRLVEIEPGGTLSVPLNRLMAESTGEIVCRLDGDLRLRTPGWLGRVVSRFAADPRLGVLGGRQLDHLGRLHSVGDLLLHPHGYQHIGAGAPPDAVVPFRAHDHVMGCFHMLRRSAFEAVGPYDETIPRGQTVDLGIRLLRGGWRAMTDADLVYEHRIALRRGRSGDHDAADSLERSRRVFLEKWGFDRLVPDRNALRERLGTGLVPEQASTTDAAGLDQSKHRVDNRVALIRGVLRPDRPTRVVLVGAGDGAVERSLLEHRIHATSIEDRSEAVESARRDLADTGVGLVPHHVPDLARIPVGDGQADVLLLDRVLERSDNPVGVLQEAARLLSPRGVLLLLARWRTPEEQIEDPFASDRFTPTSLRDLVRGTGRFLSIPVVRNPFPEPEPDVLFYALSPLEAPGLGRSAHDAVDDPTLST